MSEERSKQAQGGCHCGSVRYTTEGSPIYVPICHCESCRKTSGAPMVMYVMFPESRVAFTKGERKIYQSSPGVRRSFCGDCGTPLTWEGVWGDRLVVEVHVSTLDDPETFLPDRHVFYGEKLSWLEVADVLPRYNGSSFNTQPDTVG